MTPSLYRLRAASYRALAASWRLCAELLLAGVAEGMAERCEQEAARLEAQAAS
jgi:hypothetical protein